MEDTKYFNTFEDPLLYRWDYLQNSFSLKLVIWLAIG